MTVLTLPVAEHHHVGGSAGGPGENSAECGCGTTFAGFDTHREAVAELEHHIEQENSREKKRADQLAAGDIAVDILDGFDPWVSHRDGKVLASYPYVDEVDNPRVLLVVEGDGPKPKPETVRLDADVMVGLRSEAELEALRKVAERAARIADIRAFADWLEANPGVPMPWRIEADEHLSLGAGTEIERLAKVRQVAAMLGVEVDERLTDRTELEFKIGDLVKYSLIAWHKGGRPAEPVADERCGTCGESLREIRLGTLGHIPGEACAPVDEAPAEQGPAMAPSGLTVEADLSRGQLAGTTPVVSYFSFGYGQRDPDSGQKLIDHYVTVVAPTYEECRTAMNGSRFGRNWSWDYLAGRAKTTEAVSQWTEHEVIVAPGTDPALAEVALKAAAALLHSTECDGQDSDRPCALNCPARAAAEAS
jgi:hypothetical protein